LNNGAAALMREANEIGSGARARQKRENNAPEKRTISKLQLTGL